MRRYASDGHRKRFFTDCMAMVEAPRNWSACSRTLPNSCQSTPLWLQTRPSSDITTEATSAGAMASKPTQVRSTLPPRTIQSNAIRVETGGTKR